MIEVYYNNPLLFDLHIYTKESLDENKNNFLNNSMELNSFQLKIKLRTLYRIYNKNIF